MKNAADKHKAYCNTPRIGGKFCAAKVRKDAGVWENRSFLIPKEEKEAYMKLAEKKRRDDAARQQGAYQQGMAQGQNNVLDLFRQGYSLEEVEKRLGGR